MKDKSNSQKPAEITLFSAKKREFSNKPRNLYFLLNKIHYTGFLIQSLPKRFGYIFTENSDTEGIPAWFNRKGLTYIRTDLLKTGW